MTATQQVPAKQGGIDSFWLKVIAITGMALDHIGVAFMAHLALPAKILLFIPGGLTFPIMAYLLVEGYKHTRNVKRYALRMLIFALITQVPYVLALQANQLNVLFTLLLGLCIIVLYDRMKNRAGFWLVFVGITLATTFMDWPWVGVPMVLCYHILRGKKRIVVPVLIAQALFVLMFVMGVVMMPRFAGLSSAQAALDGLPQLLFGLVGCTATIPLLAKYNGKRGRSMKYFFYAFYPAHLLVILLVRLWVLGA